MEWCDHAIDMGKSKEGKTMYGMVGILEKYP
jgi:beta-galactosidase